MSITQIGVATLSDELLQYIKDQIKTGTLEWTDLLDTPDYAGNDGKFLQAQSGGGTSSMLWKDLPAAGLNWQVETEDFLATDKVGVLASNGITITLPAAPAEGTLVAVADHNSEFDVNPVTIAGSGGYTVEGDSTLVLDLRNAYVQIIFDGIQWELAQVNHPFNVQEITEESFPGGSLSYTLSRVPPSRSSILVTNAGFVVPTSQYSLIGNKLSFGTVQAGTVFVRHIGIASSIRVSDTPVGAMLYFPNGEAVDGWLDCTGGSITKGVYPDLTRYLSKDPEAAIAYLPDARGNFIRTWDHGSSLDTVAPQVIPVYLKSNEWGRWLDTTKDGTASNLWDGNTTSSTAVRVDKGYVGYRFDSPVSVSQINLTSNDPISAIHLPTSVQLKASTDGITWVPASAPFSGPLQNRTVTIASTVGNAYRFWAVFGTGGQAYAGDSAHYWGVTSLVFTGSSVNRLVGGFQDQAVGPMELTISGGPAAAGQVQSGTGSVVPVSGGSGQISGGPETRPDNQAYVLRIKAFHYQSGELSPSNVTSLRDEVSRLSTRVNDGTSYVQASAPENPTANARWYDTTSGRTYIWFSDGDSFQWVDDSPQSASSAQESLNAAKVLAVGSTTARALNDRFADIRTLTDFGAFRNSTSDSKAAFDAAGAGPTFIPNGSYEVSSGVYTGNIYFSFGPVVITGSATGIVIKDLLV